LPQLLPIVNMDRGVALASDPASAPDPELIAELEVRLAATRMSIPELIRRRSLYFRVSVVGNCNLSCSFCHNEGGPTRGSIEPMLLTEALKAARAVGFDRVQFTGGEPLISPRISEYVQIASGIFKDVGITTNGVLLPRKLTPLLAAGLARIHISLQKESLTESGHERPWTLPGWLDRVVTESAVSGVRVRFNLPVAESDLARASEFLVETRSAPFSLNVFALLSGSPSAPKNPTTYVDDLQAIVQRESQARGELGVPGTVQLRSYLQPQGLRCGTCRARDQCTEASRSLRLGADGVFRPCLASREWDFTTDARRAAADARAAALLALDYLPFDEEHHAI
jgi:cyclic pyranopterin phosphate synthase